MRSHISSRIASSDSAVTSTEASLEPHASCHAGGQVVETSSHLSYCSLKWRGWCGGGQWWGGPWGGLSQWGGVPDPSPPSKSRGCQEWSPELPRHRRRLPSPSRVSWTS